MSFSAKGPLAQSEQEAQAAGVHERHLRQVHDHVGGVGGHVRRDDQVELAAAGDVDVAVQADEEDRVVRTGRSSRALAWAVSETRGSRGTSPASWFRVSRGTS